MAPFRPDNWEELLAEARAAYPERAGPRRNKRAEREKNRRWVIMRQHKTRKGQQREANHQKWLKTQKNVAKMADMYNTHGFAPAMQYAAAVLQAEFDEHFDEWDQVDPATESEPATAGGRDQVLVHLKRLVALHANPPPPRVVARGQ